MDRGPGRREPAGPAKGIVTLKMDGTRRETPRPVAQTDGDFDRIAGRRGRRFCGARAGAGSAWSSS